MDNSIGFLGNNSRHGQGQNLDRPKSWKCFPRNLLPVTVPGVPDRGVIAVGVPVIAPVEELIERPAGKFEAEKVVVVVESVETE